MSELYDLDPAQPFVPRHFHRARPGKVRRLRAVVYDSGSLFLSWQPPRGGGGVVCYRIERTREGREYETIGEVRRCSFMFRGAEVGEPWFYRVTAVNPRGTGGFGLVWLYCRSNDGIGLLRAIPALPGLRITICE